MNQRLNLRVQDPPGSRVLQGFQRVKDQDASLIGAKVIRSKMRARKDPELARLQSLRKVTGLADMEREDKAYLKTKGRWNDP